MKSLYFSGRRNCLVAVLSFLTALCTVSSAQPAASTVTITQPTNGSIFLAPTNIFVGVSVVAPDGDVASVTFTASPAGEGITEPITILLGSVSNFTSLDPPARFYMFDWSNAPLGSWFLTATAQRTNGTSVGSDSVVVTVQPASGLFVDIASPADDTTFPGPTNIQLIAGVVDTNGSAATVEFFDNANPIGVSSNWAVVDPPGSPGLRPGSRAYFFDWTNDTPGRHDLTAEVTDTNGNSAYSEPVTIFIGDTNTPTTVAIIQPTNGADFIAPTNIEFVASVYNPAGDVAAVSFTASYDSGSLPPILLLGTVSNFTSLDPPTRDYSLDWSNAPAGTWLVRATAVRSDGATVDSDTVRITVQRNYSLFVDIASPTNGETFPGPTNIQLVAGVLATNAYPVAVEFFDGATPIGVVSNGVVVDPPGSPGLPPGSLAYSLDWTNQSPGEHILTAVASDTNGDTALSAPVSVFIGGRSNFPPIVRITSPPNMSVFRAPVNVTIIAFAQEPSGSISNVEFFAGTNDIGSGQQLSFNPGGPMGPQPSPVLLSNVFTLIWSNTPPGRYPLTAVALDDNGDSATSAPVNITVLAPPPPLSNAPDVVRIVATDPIAVAGTNCWSWLGGPLSWSNWESPTAIWSWFTNCGPNDATFTVFRGGSTNGDLTVNYSIGGTATNGLDYATLPGAVTIPAGQRESVISIVPIYEESNFTSTVILTLDAATNSTSTNPPAYLLGYPRSAAAIIVDNIAPRPEAGGSFLPDRSFHLSLGGPDGAWFHIDYSTDLINWTSICTNQVINGSIDFIDPDAANSSQRVYRTVPMANPPAD